MRSLLTSFLGFLVFLISFNASADITVNLVCVRGENSLTKQECINTYGQVALRIQRETGLTLSLINIQAIGNPFQRLHSSLSNSMSLLIGWEGYIARRALRADLNLIVTPPFKDPTYWMLGYAQRCARGGVAYATGEPKNSYGQDRTLHSIYALLHETLHILGAQHINDPKANVMYEGALSQLTPAGLPVLPQTVNEVLKCAGKWKPRK